MIIEQAKQITKSITPRYPLGYTEVYHITMNYLQECSMMKVDYSGEELDRRVRKYCLRNV